MDCVYFIRDETTEESAMKLKKQQTEEENFITSMGLDLYKR